jgi:hypothetical protein
MANKLVLTTQIDVPQVTADELRVNRLIVKNNGDVVVRMSGGTVTDGKFQKHCDRKTVLKTKTDINSMILAAIDGQSLMDGMLVEVAKAAFPGTVVVATEPEETPAERSTRIKEI